MQSEIDSTGLKVNPIGLGAMLLSIAANKSSLAPFPWRRIGVSDLCWNQVESRDTIPIFIILILRYSRRECHHSAPLIQNRA
jgi:hypothetical protein